MTDTLDTPPPIRRGFTNREISYTEEAKKLRNKAGQWLKIAERETTRSAHNLAYNINSGKLVAFQAEPGDGRYEAVSRGRDVWATYLTRMVAA